MIKNYKNESRSLKISRQKMDKENEVTLQEIEESLEELEAYTKTLIEDEELN